MFWAKDSIRTDSKKVEELLTRSVEEVIPSTDSLRSLLMSGKRLRIKLGIDPTSPHLHIGRAVTLLKLRDFQDLGHQIVFIVGDFTGLIGDASDKDSERPMLDQAVVDKNKKEYFSQVGKILDLKKTELRYNSEWLAKLDYRDVGEHADQFSVSDFTARELIKKRLESGQRVSLRELLYPLMQGYDSVAVRADVEIGGTDQRFNLLAGRTLQSHYTQVPQHVLITGPLLLGTDGRKMSSSWGNTINLNDAPSDMFGKVMSIPDALTALYLMHATRLPIEKIEALVGGHPKDAKMALAREIVRMYHGENAAKKAEENFVRTFSEHKAPEDVQEIIFSGSLMETLVAAGVVESNSQYRRLQEAGAIRLADTGEVLPSVAPFNRVIRIGKHRFVKVVEK